MAPRVRIDFDPNKDAMERDYQERTARFHNYDTTFPKYPTSEKEYGELATYAAYASHAGDDLPPGVDIERVVV